MCTLGSSINNRRNFGIIISASESLSLNIGNRNDRKGGKAFQQVDRLEHVLDFMATGWLKARPDATGNLRVVEFCLGGGVSNNRGSAWGDDLAAAVAFYGSAPPLEEVPKIKAAALVHRIDGQSPYRWMAAYEAALKSEWHLDSVFGYAPLTSAFSDEFIKDYHRNHQFDCSCEFCC